MKVKRKGNVILIIVISLILSTSNIFADSVVKENYVGSSRESISITNVDEVNVKVEKEQALNLAKETISKYFNCNVDKTFDERIELYEDDYPVKAYLWNISWDKYNNEEDYHISIRINAETSKVISVHKYFYEHDKVSEIPTIVKKDAKKISDNFLKTFNKELVNEVKYVEDYNKDYHSKDYSFRYVRCHNGLMFDKNHIRITVDGTTGKVISYSENWDYNIEFEKVDDIKSEKLIQDLFYNNIDMNLLYLSDDRGCESVNKVRLVYKREYNDSKNFIDAKTGEFIQYDSKRDTNELSKDEIEKLTLGRSIKRDNKNKLTINEAKEIIEKYSKELLTDYTIESITYWKDSNCNKENDEIYRAELLKGNKKDRYHICLSIDAYTGEIIYYDNYRFEIMDSELKTNSVKSWDECYDIAIRTVAKYYPDKIDQINTKQEYYKSDDYNDFFNFSFNRQINGINYDRDSINVEINGLNGEVVHLTYDWNTNITFPSIDKDKIIDSKKAKEIFFKEYKPVLVYNKGKNDKKVKVIYKLHKECEHPFRYSLIDANSGKLIDYSGK
jgi:predicted small secreted protein